MPQARDRLAESAYAPHIERLAEALQTLWSTRDEWGSREVFTPLKEIARAVLADGGMIVTRRSDGQAYVDIPFTPDTMPEDTRELL